MKPFTRLTRFTQRFARDEGGNILILFGLCVLFLVGIGGAAIDFGREQEMTVKLQQATDAAATSAAAMTNQGKALTSDQEKAVATRYFNLNFFLQSASDKRPTPNVSITGTNLIVSTDPTDPSTITHTNFVSNFGVKTLTSQGSSTVLATPATTVPFDVILVLDNSGSMSYPDAGNGPAQAAANPAVSFNAAKADCTNEFVSQGYTRSYAASYCANYTTGASTTVGNNWVNGYGVDSTASMRMGALRYAANFITTDLLPADNTTNRVATVLWSNILIDSSPLSTTASVPLAKITTMFAYGGTDSSVGLQQAQTISANFNNAHTRAVVLLTDGQNTQHGQIKVAPNGNKSDPSGCDSGSYCAAASNASLPICSSLKNGGVLVYTIAFGKDATGSGAQASNAKAFLQSCASGQPATNQNQYYFEAPDSTKLQAIFTQITGSLKSVRIVQ